MKRLVPLEVEAEKVCDNSSKPPLIFQLPPEEGRKKLDQLQDSPVYKYPTCVATSKWGKINVHFIVPINIMGRAHVIYYIHGAGWVFGNLHTHDKLVRELAARTNSVVVFPEYSLSPEAKYPTAIEQLKGLPDAMILNGEADVLCDEGEAYARKLRKAGVDVTAMRYQAIIHDFVMLNALDQTKGCRAAMDSSTQWINRKNAEVEEK